MAPHHDWLYPRLREVPEAERADALRRARATSFDVLELVGIALSLVLVTAITPNVAVAIVLFALLAAPLFVRRIRRGIDRQLEARGAR